MKELEPYKAYIIPEDGFNIYLYALGKNWVAVKYGKNDSIQISGTYSLGNNLLKKEGIRKVSLSYLVPEGTGYGFERMGQHIIKELFEGRLNNQADMIGR
jgi:hypothetical protein